MSLSILSRNVGASHHDSRLDVNTTFALSIMVCSIDLAPLKSSATEKVEKIDVPSSAAAPSRFASSGMHSEQTQHTQLRREFRCSINPISLVVHRNVPFVLDG